jgi:DNA-binding transcriptional regulator YhcF (GntR family)
LASANYEDKTFFLGYTKYTIRRGECAYSLRTWATIFGCSVKAVNNFFSMLESEEMITKKTIGKGKQRTTVINITKYDDYQDVKKHKRTHERTITNHITIKPTIKKADNNHLLNGVDHSGFLKNIKDQGTTQWVETVYMQFRLKKLSVGRLLVQFADHLKLEQTQHVSQREFEKHFINWLRVKQTKGELEKYKV